MILAGILAGGTGSRMENAKMPKQFIEVGGVPIFIRTLRTFLSVEGIDGAVVSMNRDWASKYEELLERFSVDRGRVHLVPGGDSRFTSLMAVVKGAREFGAQKAPEEKPEDLIVISHDGARLFVSQEIIRRNIQAMTEYRICTTSLPVIDTVLASEDGKSLSYVPERSHLWNDQGPQSFRAEEFLTMAEKIPQEELGSYIEATKLYMEYHIPIGITPGDRYNFKVTNDFDLKYSEFLLKEGYVK